MNTKISCLISIVLVAVVCENICFGSEVETGRVAPDEGGIVYHADIAVAFMYQRSGHVLINSDAPFVPYSIYVMIWNDGHVLLREQPDTDFRGEDYRDRKEEATYKFQRNILSKDSVDTLQKKLISLFRLKGKRIHMGRYPLDAPCKVITINTNQSSVIIDLLELQTDIDTYRKDPMGYRVLHEDNTVDNKAMYLEEFYEKWMTAKKEIYTFAEKIDSRKLFPVDVVVSNDVPQRPQLRLYNKEGTLLLQQDIRR